MDRDAPTIDAVGLQDEQPYSQTTPRLITTRMPSMAPLQLILAIWLVPTVLAVPAPTQPPEVAAALPRYPNVTPPPALVQRDIADTVGSYIDGVLSSLGSDVSSYVASGIPEWFENLPTGTAVESSLSISDSDLAATPTQVLNLPYVHVLLPRANPSAC